MDELQGLGRVGMYTLRNSSGIGYIIIPDGIDRDGYVEQCHRTGMVDVYTENGEILKDTPVDIDAFQKLLFPENSETLGSPVVWVNIPVNEKPVVVAVLTGHDQLLGFSEGQFKQRRTHKGNVVDLTGNAKNGSLSATVKGKKAKIDLYVVTPDNSGEFNVHVKGNVNVYAEGQLDIKAAEGMTYEDEFKNKIILNSDGMQILTEKMVFGEGKERMVLGDTLKAKMEALFGILKKLTVATALGTSSVPLQVPELTQLEMEIGEILSELTHTD